MYVNYGGEKWRGWCQNTEESTLETGGEKEEGSPSFSNALLTAPVNTHPAAATEALWYLERRVCKLVKGGRVRERDRLDLLRPKSQNFRFGEKRGRSKKKQQRGESDNELKIFNGNGEKVFSFTTEPFVYSASSNSRIEKEEEKEEKKSNKNLSSSTQ